MGIWGAFRIRLSEDSAGFHPARIDIESPAPCDVHPVRPQSDTAPDGPDDFEEDNVGSDRIESQSSGKQARLGRSPADEEDAGGQECDVDIGASGGHGGGPGNGSHGEPGEEPEAAPDEALAPAFRKTPATPSADEIQQHNLTHLPFRAWCPTCVCAWGKSDAHHDRHREFDGVPSIHIDYYFLSDEVSDVLLTCVCMRERFSKCIFTYVVDHKGSDDGLEAQLVHWGCRRSELF